MSEHEHTATKTDIASGKHSLSDAVPAELAGLRLDQALAQMFPEFSRSQLTQSIKDGTATVDGKACKPRDRVLGEEHVALSVTIAASESIGPEDIPLNVVFEDEQLLILNKPAGLVVHPGAGNPTGTLQNGLLHYSSDLEGVPRAGIIHRLDKDTSGLMVVAKTVGAHTCLVDKLAARDIHRFYDCTVMGRMVSGGTVDEPIGRHKTDRLKMAVRRDGRPAVTHYRVQNRYRAHTRLRVQLETGRTHQIRVHMTHLKRPLVGDPVYGGRLAQPPHSSKDFLDALREFRRQALHATELHVPHPITGEVMEFTADIPADMARLHEAMMQDAAEHAHDE